jgi:sugar phosphate isomerase/epimerase
MPFLKQRISTMDRIVNAVAEVNSPYVGICLDTGHVNVFAEHDLGDAVRQAAPYLKTLHIHDNDGKGDRHMLPYLGTANWDSFTTALAEIGYTGSMSMETSGPVSSHMPQHLHDLGNQLTVATAQYLAKEVDRKKVN